MRSTGFFSRSRAQCRGLALLLAVCAPASASAESLRVAKAAQQEFAFAVLDVGLRQGFFAKQGLEIEGGMEFGGSPQLQQAMAAGSVDIGLGSGTDLAYEMKGAPVKAIAAMAGPPLGLVIAVKADGPIKTVADLKGKSIGVSGTASLTAWLTRELSRQQGWGTNGISVDYTGSVSARWAALTVNQIDGTAVGVGSALQAEQRGLARIALNFGDYVKAFHVHAIYATNNVIESKPEAIRAFLRGWLDTIAFMRANKSETVKIVQDSMRVDAEIASRTYDITMPELSPDGRFDAAALAALARSFVELKILPTEPDMSGLYTEAFLPGK
jgi:NitT/TauT family transport system substrate-binding protein